VYKLASTRFLRDQDRSHPSVYLPEISHSVNYATGVKYNHVRLELYVHKRDQGSFSVPRKVKPADAIKRKGKREGGGMRDTQRVEEEGKESEPRSNV
jgi:hypothetical protein